VAKSNKIDNMIRYDSLTYAKKLSVQFSLPFVIKKN